MCLSKPRARALLVAATLSASSGGYGVAGAQELSRTSQSNDTLRLREHRPAKNYTRTLEEYMFISGVFGIPWYWGSQNFNQRNWDLKWTWTDWKRKAITFDAVRMDGDDFQTNSLKHPFLSGTADFLVARTNHLAIPESFLLASLNSVMWEYLVEFREKPSINDMITTPFAGMAIGEVLFQFGEFFNRGGDQPVNWTLSTLLGGLQQLHARMDNQQLAKSPGVDDYGFPLDRWHRFELSAALGEAWLPGARETRTQVGLDTEIVTIPTWEKAGQVHRWITDEGFSRLSAHLTLHERGIQQGIVRAYATLGGYYDQDIRGSRHGGGLNGYALFAGVHAAFEYSQTFVANFHDQMAIMSLFGLGSDLMLHLGRMTLRASLDVSPEFGMISAFAGPAYVASLLPDGKTKVALQQHNYYYSLGLGVAPAVQVEVLPFFAGADGHFQQFNSIDGLERAQSELTSDAHLTDRRISYRAFVGLRPASLIQFTISAEERLREGRVSVFHSSLRERIVTVGTAFIL